ncbi:MAG: Pr6Pr family membrane protein, partial [Nocardioidaceae bacterium]|nr:Pr6Pr family membrane protein [Nocardioidaceae bacterium]
RHGRVAAGWHACTVLVIASAIVIQLVLVVRGVNVLVEDDGGSAAAPERVLRFFSYFTVQSNIVSMVTAALLLRDPHRDGPAWRVARFAAILAMAVTFVVYIVVLRPLLDLEGAPWLTDLLFHYVAPVMTVGGWLLFGPAARASHRVLGVVIVWPLAYFVYTQLLGAASDWYPYPFLDSGTLGLARVGLNAVGVTVLVLGLGSAFVAADRRLPRPGR